MLVYFLKQTRLNGQESRGNTLFIDTANHPKMSAVSAFIFRNNVGTVAMYFGIKLYNIITCSFV